MSKAPKDDLTEAKAIAARMLAMPPQPHEKSAGKPKPAERPTKSLQGTKKRRKQDANK